MSNLILPCEYCGRLCNWPVSIAQFGVPACCQRCRARVWVNIVAWTVIMIFAVGVAWVVHSALRVQ